MIRKEIETAWPEIASKLRNRFAKLKHADLDYVKGKEDELLDRIQSAIGKNRQEIMTLIATL
jgi:hypothetical protein